MAAEWQRPLAGPVAVTRAVRTEHLAWTLAILQSAGFVLTRPITYEEYINEESNHVY